MIDVQHEPDAPRSAPAESAQLIVDQLPTCWRCERTLAEYATRPWSIKCRRCGAKNRDGTRVDEPQA